MSAVNLKVRAKRLRTAVANMFNVSVSVAQSLELVAKEENFPTWDAAASCCTVSQAIPAPTFHAWSSLTASNMLTKNSQHGRVIVGRSGSGKHHYALNMILDQLRFGRTVVAIDRGMSYYKFVELVGGTYHHLQNNSRHEMRRFGDTPLVVYDLDKIGAIDQASWTCDLPGLPPALLTENGFLFIDEVWAVEHCYPGAGTLLKTVAKSGGSYCVAGQNDDDVRRLTEANVPFMLTVRLESSHLRKDA